MAELKIICKHPDSLRRFIEEAVESELHLLSEGIKRTEEHIQEFEAKYQLSTEEFIRRFENDEIQHSLDMEFDEWIGESRMLKRLREKADRLRGIAFVN